VAANAENGNGPGFVPHRGYDQHSQLLVVFFVSQIARKMVSAPQRKREA